MSVAPKFLAAILLAFSLWAQVGQAQDKSPANTGSDPPARTESEQSPEGAQIAISKAGDAPSAPDIFFLPDAAGKLRRVLGYRYEDFLKAWQGQDERHGESDRPTFVIADLSGTLKASGDVVQAKFSITV